MYMTGWCWFSCIFIIWLLTNGQTDIAVYRDICLYWDIHDLIASIFICFHVISCILTDLYWFLLTGSWWMNQLTDALCGQRHGWIIIRPKISFLRIRFSFWLIIDNLLTHSETTSTVILLLFSGCTSPMKWMKQRIWANSEKLT